MQQNYMYSLNQENVDKGQRMESILFYDVQNAYCTRYFVSTVQVQYLGTFCTEGVLRAGYKQRTMYRTYYSTWYTG